MPVAPDAGDRIDPDGGERIKRSAFEEPVAIACTFERRARRKREAIGEFGVCGSITKRKYKRKGYGSFDECKEREKFAFNYDQFPEAREPESPEDDECTKREKLAWNYDQFEINPPVRGNDWQLPPRLDESYTGGDSVHQRSMHEPPEYY